MRRRIAILLAVIMCLMTGCDGSWSTGDRVLVAKHLYDLNLPPRRFDVVVFKYPMGPMENGSPKNYIKRLLGLPGELIAIFFGQLFHWFPEPGDPVRYDDSHVDPNNLWWRDRAKIREGGANLLDRIVPPPEGQFGMHEDDAIAKALFDAGKFKIIRKTPDVMMALRRIVYDNDHQAKKLSDVKWQRWLPEEGSAWIAENEARTFRHPGTDKEIHWLRYRHIVPNWEALAMEPGPPQLITDFLAYNTANRTPSGFNWAGDLMLECRLKVDKAEGAFLMELSRGIYRFRARWDLDKGQCTLERKGPKGKWEELDSQPTAVKKPGTYDLRFANFDARLTVWVDKALPFGDGRDYPPPEIRNLDDKNNEKALTEEELKVRRGPTENDLQKPASVGSQGAAVHVERLRLWRDTCYTLRPGTSPDGDPTVDWADPKSFDKLRSMSFKTIYVQPGHYLCLGDNSPSSSDGRDWGLVPQRLMLGRALLVYFPFSRFGPIR